MARAIRANRFARIDSQRESFAIEPPIFIARQADSHESLEFPIRANHAIRANRANRFARITPLTWPRPPATGLRKPKSLGRVLGRVLGKGLLGGDCWEQCWEDGFVRKSRGTALFPAVPPALPFSRHSPHHSRIWAFSVL